MLNSNFEQPVITIPDELKVDSMRHSGEITFSGRGFFPFLREQSLEDTFA